MFQHLGRLATTRSRLVLVVTGLGIVLAALAGIHVTSKLKSSGFVSANAPSQLATNRLDSEFGGTPNLVLLVQAKTGSVDQASVAAAGRAVATRVAASSGVTQVTSYWATGNPALRSRDGTEALVLAHVAGDDTVLKNRTNAIEARVDTTAGPTTVRAGGLAAANNAIGTQIGKDLRLAESIAIPATMILLILAFGSVVAAALPVAIGLVSILATLAILWVLGSVTNVSIYALNLTTAMSLGLAIDYSLLMVNRYREELAAGYEVAEAVTRSVATAGRTILFSAATVAAAMAALLVFPVYFLRSFAYAGISVVVLATVGALVDPPCPAGGPRAPGQRRSRAPRVLAAGVRPARVPVLAPGGHRRHAPAAGCRPPGRRRARSCSACPSPTSISAHRTTGCCRRAPRPARSVTPCAPSSTPTPTTPSTWSRPGLCTGEAAATYSQRLSAKPGVVQVTGPAGIWVAGHQVSPRWAMAAQHQSGQGSWFSAVISPDPLSGAAQSLVGHVRSVAVPGGATAYVGGAAASLVDQKHDLGSRLPLALLLIVLTTLIVLWLFTGSVVLPLQGPGAQRAEPERGVRRHGVDLPGRPSVRAARVHAPADQHDHALAALLHRFRAVDGLRGLHAVPDQGAARRRRVERGRGSGRPGPHRADHHHRGGADGRDLPGLRHLQGQLHPDVRHRHGAGHPGRRHADPRRAGAGLHAPRGRSQLVVAGRRCAGSTTALAWREAPAASPPKGCGRPPRNRVGAGVAPALAPQRVVVAGDARRSSTSSIFVDGPVHRQRAR